MTKKKHGFARKSRKSMLNFLRAFMPEIIYRTTKLEGEPVTRRMISGLFK